TGSQTLAVTSADVNGDGQSDVVVSNYGAGSVSVLLQAGATQTTAEDTTLTINGISVSDIDAGSAQIKVTLAVGHGTLTVDETGLDAPSTNNAASIDLYGSQVA